MRMIGADDGEALRLRLVDAAAASDLREVIDWRDFVPPRRVRGAVAAGNCFEYVGSGFSRTYRVGTGFSRTYRVGTGFSRTYRVGAGFSRPMRAADEQSAAFLRRITPRVRDDCGQCFAIDSDVRQPGPR
jgi:hypothetical protein